MKILLCNYEYPPLGGGGGVVMAALARQFARRHEVTVLTSRAMGLPAQSIEDGVHIVRVPVYFRRALAVANFPSMFAYLPNAAWRGWRLQHATPFDVVNTHFVVPTGPVGQFLASISRIPNILSIHGGDLFDPSKSSSPHRHAVLRSAIRHMLAKADVVVGQSRDTVRHVADLYHVHRPMELIPLGIERPPSIATVSRDEFGLPADAFVMATVGRLVPRKSVEQLARAMHASQASNAHLLVVGDGPEAATLRAAAAQLGIGGRVHLLGQVSEADKYRALSVSDIFVSTSQHEGFGLVFLEAMAMGLPIICYDRGGQTDFLATGVTGEVVKLNDLEGFVRAIDALHAQADVRAAVGRRNRERVEEYFIDHCARRYELLFERAVASRTRKAG